MRGTASAMTSKSRHVSVAETVVGLETHRKKSKKRRVYVVGVAGLNLRPLRPDRCYLLENTNKTNDF
jgi:hypothetical protein